MTKEILELADSKELVTYIDNNLVRTIVKGKGKPILLIHGLGISAQSWEKNINELSTCGKVYAIDLPGFGESDKPSKIYNTKELADILFKWCSKLNLYNVTIMGHSLGGEICLWFAIKYPSMVRKMILVASTGLEYEFSFLKRFSGLIADSFIEPIKFFPTLFKAYIKSGPFRIFETARKSQSQELHNLLHTIKVDTLIISAKKDPVISVEESKKMSKIIKGATLKIINGTHGVIFDNPEKFNEIVCNYIK